MATLPNLHRDPTLEAVDAAIEARQERYARDYLGMSSIGSACDRALWYGFRWATDLAHNAATLKRFADGHHGEALQAMRLRMVAGIELHTVDGRGKQFGFYDLGGHLRGHIDGAILGLLQAPKTWHIWEHKQVDEKKFRALEKAKRELGEKAALEAWDETYFTQGQLYMHFAELTRHYLTCSTPGGRNTISVRTNYHQPTAWRALSRARAIITAAEPPARISDDPGFYQCNWCPHAPICHHGALPIVNCRTCVHSTPELDGDRRWSCARWGRDLSVPEQIAACDQHLFIPALTPWPVKDADPVENSITYEGGIINGGPGGRSSTALRELAAV